MKIDSCLVWNVPVLSSCLCTCLAGCITGVTEQVPKSAGVV
jgi:hypothetical protein